MEGRGGIDADGTWIATKSGLRGTLRLAEESRSRSFQITLFPPRQPTTKAVDFNTEKPKEESENY
jgi:hypothetical protein